MKTDTNEEISFWTGDGIVSGIDTMTYDGNGWSWEEYYDSIKVEQREKTIDGILDEVNNK
tara:strand:- start:1273 stop:1452 length:180 start_codon:yes stop_codon:yes gene_type:complete